MDGAKTSRGKRRAAKATPGDAAYARAVKEARHALKVAHRTRRYSRDAHSMLFRLSKWLLERPWARKWRRAAPRLIVEYDRGLINVGAWERLESRILFYGYHEPELSKLITRLVRPGDVCIDLGAHVGAHTLVLGFAAGPSGRVIAVEPHPAIAERLLENISLNRLANVTVVQAAIADTDGAATFYGFQEGAKSEGYSSLLPRPVSSDELTVRTLTGPSLLAAADVRSADFIKVEAAGYEMVALRGFAELIREHRPCILFHYSRYFWKQRGDDIAEALQLFRELDYHLYVREGTVVIPFQGEAPRSCTFLCVPRLKAIELPPLDAK